MTQPSRHLQRVLLISANTETDPQPVFPLGLENLAAGLRAEGREPAIYDCLVCGGAGGEMTRFIRDFGPDVVCVSIRNIDNNDSTNAKSYLPGVQAIAEAAKAAAPGAPLVLGGSGYALFPDRLLEALRADYGIRGEGESALPSLLAALERGVGIEDTPGLVRAGGGKVLMNAPARGVSFSGVPQRDARLAELYLKSGGCMNVQMKRGCRHKCVYCTYPALEGKTHRRRGVAETVSEIQSLHESLGADNFFVVDSVINDPPGDASGFARELIGRGMKIGWTAFFMPKDVSEEDASLWRESGLEGAEFGADTLNDSLASAWGKPFSGRQALESARACAAADLPYVLYLVLGGPGETERTMNETLETAARCPRAVVFVFAGMRIYPGTPLHAIAGAEGIIGADTDLLAPKFYIARGVEKAMASALDHAAKMPNWMVAGRSLAATRGIRERMRRSGKQGALWRLLRPPE